VVVARKAKPVIGSLLIMDELRTMVGYGTAGAAFNPPPTELKKGDLVVLRTTAPGAYHVVSNAAGRQYHLAINSTFLRPPREALKKASEMLVNDCKGQSPVGKGYGYYGNDPEVFVLDGNGMVMPAFAFLPSKNDAVWENATERFTINARPEKPELNGRKVFYDGFQAEFTSPAHTCFGYGCDYTRFGLKSIRDRAIKIDPKAELTWAPVVDVPLDLIANSPKEGVLMGCDPSKNAYTGEENPALLTLDPYQLPFRFAGYHIHFGVGKKSEATYRRIVRALDAIVGVFSVAIFDGMEDPRRRLYYGLAGEYRTPEHGLEWRTLSSCVLCHPGTFHLLSDLSRVAACMAQAGWRKVWKSTPDKVRSIINNLDVEEARKLIKENASALKMMLSGPYGKDTKPVTNALTLAEKGVKQLMSLNMVNNWCLDKDWGHHSNNNTAFWSTVTF